MTKKEKIILEDLRHINGKITNCFKVRKVVNTIEFQVGEYLSTSKVEEQIRYNKDMTVEIVARK